MLAVLLASLAAAALVVLAMVFLGEYTKTRGRLLLTATSLAGFCTLALAPAALSQRDKFRLVSLLSLTAVGLGFLLVIVGTWATPSSDAYWKVASIVSIWAVYGFDLCWLLLLEPSRQWALLSWWAAAGAGGLVPVLAAIAIVAEIKATPFWWAVTLLVMILVVGSLAAPVFNRWRLPIRLTRFRAPIDPDEVNPDQDAGEE